MKQVITTEKLPIKLWTDNIEDGALQQAKNLANLPFAYKHIAIMPDVHQGYGMPIGGVMATKGVIVSNAVGVDIGCFSGDTKIPLLNGTQKTLRELTDENKNIYVYSLDENLDLVVGKATPKLTGLNKLLLEVTISGGETIKCTPEHKFMLIDGSYREARDLLPFDSLMPLYRSYETKDGYEHIRTTTGTRVITHKMVAKQFLGEKQLNDLIHHKDHNWYNNDPSNIEYKDKSLHSREHRKDNPIFSTNEFKVKRLEILKSKGFYDSKYKEKKKIIAINNIKEYNKSNIKKEQDRLSGQRGKKYLIAYNKSDKGRAKSSEIGKLYDFRRKITNHKVLFVKVLDKLEDVYCLTVAKYHNFALSAGIFVHNCGMTAIKSDLTTKDVNEDLLKDWMVKIREEIPTGFDHRDKPQENDLFKDAPDIPIIQQELNSAKKQLGTLGGGNHFLEIQRDEEGFIWIMIHSGSRNFGYKTAKVYHEKAKKLCERWFSNIPTMELAFLPIETKEAKEYFEAMNYCLRFAYTNRNVMLGIIMLIIGIEHFNVERDRINIHHNYAAWENHFGQNVLVHRKGATLARKGTIGIIPGSMGTPSYIVKGLGNPQSFDSCSHGAGRKMGRAEATRTLNLEDEQKKMEGIIGAPRNTSDLDEAPGAYKDIDEVMENQKDLVTIVTKLTPLAVIKG